jgi:hypothetical protein
MLFLLAYPVAVWLRHHVHFPQHSIPSEAGEAGPLPLIHSAPDANATQPTEIDTQHGSLPN